MGNEQTVATGAIRTRFINEVIYFQYYICFLQGDSYETFMADDVLLLSASSVVALRFTRELRMILGSLDGPKKLFLKVGV